MKAMILAVEKEKAKINTRSGEVEGYNVILGFDKEGDSKYNGFVPSVQIKYTKVGNRPFGTVDRFFGLDVLNGYVPQPCDIVEIVYGPNNSIVQLKKVNA